MLVQQPWRTFRSFIRCSLACFRIVETSSRFRVATRYHVKGSSVSSAGLPLCSQAPLAKVGDRLDLKRQSGVSTFLYAECGDVYKVAACQSAIIATGALTTNSDRAILERSVAYFRNDSDLPLGSLLLLRSKRRLSVQRCDRAQLLPNTGH